MADTGHRRKPRYLAFAWQPGGDRDRTVQCLREAVRSRQPAWTEVTIGEGLARISHQFSPAAGDVPHPASFSRLGTLDVLSSTPARPSDRGSNASVRPDRKHHCARHLADLATKPGEKCGLVVLYTGFGQGRDRVYPLSGEDAALHGVVLGKLFKRRYISEYRIGDGAPEDPVLSGRESRAVVDTAGRHLIKHYWGAYVAFFTDPARRSHAALRDPSGLVPCFFIEHQGISIFFSDIEDCARLPDIRFSLNWQYIGRFLHFEGTHRSDTGLNEVGTLLPGYRRDIVQEGPRSSCCWSSVAIARAGGIEDPAEVTELLFRTAVACVGSWASCYGRIMLRLSGGLDSTLVLSGLRQARHGCELLCLHYYAEAMDSEERRWARIAAAHAGVELVERRIGDPEVGIAQMATMPRSVLPLDYHYGLGAARTDLQLLQESGAEACFSGHGGDEVLNATGTPFSAVDHLLRHGLGSSLLSAAMDAALLSQTSLWSVLRLVLDHGIRQRPCDPLGYTGPLQPSVALHPSLREALDVRDITHPLLEDTDLPPGKLLHVFAVHSTDMSSMATPAGSYIDQVHPLYSQPLIELCLRIPSYLLSTGGMNRGLARRAFLGAVAPEILAHSSKGSGDSHHEHIAVEHSDLIREYLLDGVLVRNGLLDRAGIEQALSGDRSAAVAVRAKLLDYVYVEDWARRWTEAR